MLKCAAQKLSWSQNLHHELIQKQLSHQETVFGWKWTNKICSKFKLYVFANHHEKDFSPFLADHIFFSKRILT